MTKENSIRVKMFRVEGDVVPFVQVDYLDKEAKEHTGLLLLDSGSNINLLAPEMDEEIGDLCKLEGERTIIHSMAEGTVEAEKAKFIFAMGGKQFGEVFCLCPQKFPVSVAGIKVLGLLGNEFFLKHRLVIDYSDYTLHTSEVDPSNLSISDCGFFFPMNIGLEYYDVPVISIKQNGKELVTLIDTGATNNMIAKLALKENKFKHKWLEEKGHVVNVTGELDVEEAQVWFKIMSLNGNGVRRISRHFLFKVLPCNIHTLPEGSCDANGEELPPVEVLLGAPFMAREKWVLDFGAKIMYKRKVA